MIVIAPNPQYIGCAMQPALKGETTMTNLNETAAISVHIDGLADSYVLQVSADMSGREIKEAITRHFRKVHEGDIWDLFTNPDGKVEPFQSSKSVAVYRNGVLLPAASVNLPLDPEHAAQREELIRHLERHFSYD
jgi:hypothetical protein